MPDEGGSFLDPRTKILLIITVSGLLIQCGLTTPMLIWNGVLLSVPLMGHIKAGKKGKALFCGLFWLTVLLLLAFLLPVLTGTAAIVLSAFAAVFVKIMPGITFGLHTIGTIEASDLIAALSKMHMPKFLVWTISMVFRFFPTVKEEFGATVDGLRMRGHTVGWCILHPISAMEDVFVPLIVSVVGIGDELLMATLSKGFSVSGERTSITDPRMKIGDWAAIALMAAAWWTGHALE